MCTGKLQMARISATTFEQGAIKAITYKTPLVQQTHLSVLMDGNTRRDIVLESDCPAAPITYHRTE